jgi:hypothetical protein
LLLWTELIHLIGHMQTLLSNFVQNSMVIQDYYSSIWFRKNSFSSRSQWMGWYLCCIWREVCSSYLFLASNVLFSIYLDMLSLLARFALLLNQCFVSSFLSISFD